MRTDFGKLLDDMVDGYTPSPTLEDEINRKVEEVEKKLSDMIENKLSTINISQEESKPVDNDTIDTDNTHDAENGEPSNESKGE